MSEKTKFTVRPFSRPARSDLKDSLRVNLSAAALLALKLRAGEQCILQQDGKPDRPAVAWQAVEKIQDTVVQISKTLQDLYGLNLGDKLSISIGGSVVQDARMVEAQEALQNDSSLDNELSEEDRPHWEWFLHDPISRAETLIPGLRLDLIQARGQKRSFIISQIDGVGSNPRPLMRKYASTTKITIRSREDQPQADGISEKVDLLEVSNNRIGGLQRQLEQINLLLRRFEVGFRSLTSSYNYEPSQGLLLYGSKGTGKSLVIDELAACSWRNVIRWSAVSSARSDTNEQLQKTFSDALHQQPCLVIIEQIEAVASKRGTLEGSHNLNLLPAFLKAFDLIRRAAVLVVAEVRHANDIEDGLRTQTRFGIEIELPVPAAKGRLEILQCIRGGSDQPADETLTDIAERTHGYVGADLFALYQRIIEQAAYRTLASGDSKDGINEKLNGFTLNGSGESSPHPRSTNPKTTLTILPTDITSALSSTRPSAMQEVILENPNIHWSDIGGQKSTKLRLQRAVSRPLHHSSTMARLNLRSNRGILLYGPPGCSKTLLVKALATESGLNFLAVKGAELVSMYVGESERAIREVFRKARAASPSIVFFDEFDSIASSRTPSSNSGGSSGGNLNILTTLLNELDGFEALRNVLIVAATNRPEILDPALLRPGRLDHLVYVGPPDLEARKEILRIWLGKSDTQSDVDVDALAAQMEGYSGAEIVSVCETAAGLAMDEVEEKGGDGEEVKIGMEHLSRALREVCRGITVQVVRGYLEWGAGRGGS